MNEIQEQSSDRASDQAKGRFLALQMLRLSGIALVILGLLIVNGVIALPAAAGFAMLAIGIADALFAPPFLARKWKSPPS